MADLGFNLLIGAALTSTVGQAFTSIKKQASLTIKDTEKLQLGKKWSEELLDLTEKLKLNKEEMRQVGRTAETIQIRQELLDRLSEAKTEAANFGVNLANAGKKAAEFNQKINFNTSMEGLGSAFSEMRAGVSVGLGGLAKAGAMGAGLFMTVSSFEHAASGFQKGMANVGTLLDGDKTQKAARLQELGENVKSLSEETGLSLGDLQNGLYQTVSAFGDTAESSAKLGIAAKAALAGGAETADAINLMSAVTKGYNDTTAEASQKAMDLAFNTVKLGQTDFPALAHSMGQVIPTAATLKVKQEELFGAFATLTGVTGTTSEVATQLKATLAGLLDPTKEMDNALQRLGYSSGKEILEQRGLEGALAALKFAVNDDELAFAQLFSSMEAKNAVLALTGAQADNFREKTASMSDASGMAQKAYEDLGETTEVRMARMHAAMDRVKVEIGEAFIPTFSKIGETVASIVVPIGNFISQHPNLIEGLTTAGAAIAFYGALKLGLIIHAVVKGVKGAAAAYKLYKTTTEGATFIQWAFNAAMHANPIGLVIAGVMALGVAIYAVYKNWDDIKTWVIEHFDTIMKYLKWFAFPIWAIVKLAKTIYDNWEPILNWFSEKIEWFSRKIDLLKKGWNMIFGGGTATITAVSKIDDLNSGKSSGSISVAKDIPLQTNVRNEKNVNVSMPNITINSANLDESLPTITEKVRAAVMAGARDDMENSYAY